MDIKNVLCSKPFKVKPTFITNKFNRTLTSILDCFSWSLIPVHNIFEILNTYIYFICTKKPWPWSFFHSILELFNLVSKHHIVNAPHRGYHIVFLFYIRITTTFILISTPGKLYSNEIHTYTRIVIGKYQFKCIFVISLFDASQIFQICKTMIFFFIWYTQDIFLFSVQIID